MKWRIGKRFNGYIQGRKHCIYEEKPIQSIDLLLQYPKFNHCLQEAVQNSNINNCKIPD
jgi:hypothetical protein